MSASSLGKDTISPKWLHPKITSRTPSFCSQYFIYVKSWQMQFTAFKKTSALNKLASCWPCISPSPTAELDLPRVLLIVTTSIPHFWAIAESVPTISSHSSNLPIQRLLVQFTPSMSMSDTSLSLVSSANCWGCTRSLHLCHYWRY